MGGMLGLKGGGYVGGTGELVPIQLDPLLFRALEYYEILYSEGLIPPDIFTQRNDFETRQAMRNADYITFFMYWRTNELPDDDFLKYRLLPPLTSEYNDQQWSFYGPHEIVSSNLFYVTDKATDLQAEAYMRFADIHFCRDFRYNPLHGPQAGVDDTYGIVTGWYRDPETRAFHYHDVDDGTFETVHAYRWNISYLAAWAQLMNRRWYGDVPPAFPDDRMTHQTYWSRRVGNAVPNHFKAMPEYMYPEEGADEIQDLRIALLSHSNTQHARFITGDRPLTIDEFDRFGAELNAMGYERVWRAIKEVLDTKYSK
jgi:hypothetical protein